MTANKHIVFKKVTRRNTCSYKICTKFGYAKILRRKFICKLIENATVINNTNLVMLVHSYIYQFLTAECIKICIKVVLRGDHFLDSSF